MKRKIIPVIGAVVCVLLMVSSACAINIVQEQTMKDTNDVEQSEVYVDPNIQLTNKHLSMLSRSLLYLENLEEKELIKNIIFTIEEKGNVNSKDIQNIINDLNLDIKGIHSGIINAKGAGDIFFVFPGTIRFVKWIIGWGLSAFRILPTLVAQFYGYPESQQPYPEVQVKINLIHEYTYRPMKGTIIGFVGPIGYAPYGSNPLMGRREFWARGFSTLIILS